MCKIFCLHFETEKTRWNQPSVKDTARNHPDLFWKIRHNHNPAKGLTITMEFIGEEPSVHMIDARSPCSFVTAWGIRIGSAEAAVVKAYAKDRSRYGYTPGKRFLAGSVYDGVEFSFKQGKVTRIFVGVTAE